MDNMQPGQIIIPHGSDDPQQPSPGAPVPERPLEEPGETPNPAPTPVPAPEPVHPAAVLPSPVEAEQALESQPEAGWQFHSAVGTSAAAPAAPEEDITWTGSEFIDHQKGLGWYGMFIAAGVLAAAADYLLLKDVFSSVIILFAAVAFVAISARKPRTQQYTLTYHGLQIGVKAYYFQDYKNFSIVEDGAIASIVFMPLKRFMPPLTIYVAPDMEERIVDFLSTVLPFEQHRTDAVDSLMRRIRF